MLSIGNSIGIPFSRRSAGGGFDPDYQAVLDYATTEGYTLPSAGQQVLQNQLVLDLKAAGAWAKLDSIALFATDGDADFALIDWIRLSNYTAVNSPDFIPNEGFFNDGISSYINTNFNPFTDGVNYRLNNASRYTYYDNTNGEKVNSILDGNIGAVQNYMRIGNFNGHRINSNNNLLSSFNYTNVNQLKSIHRVNSTDVTLYNGSTGTTINQNSMAVFNETQKIYKILNTSSLLGQYTCKMYSMGASMVSENTDFNNAINTYLTSI